MGESVITTIVINTPIMIKNAWLTNLRKKQ